MWRILIVSLLATGCLGSGPQDVKIANWPHGYQSAACITFDTEQATGTQIETVTSALGQKNATFFVVAGYYEDREEDLEPLRGYDVGSMAWWHGNWENSDLSREFQLGEMERAHTWLVDRGFNPRGFRAPFLNSNDATLRAVRDMGYMYDSSQYLGTMPYIKGGLVEIPLSLNFDTYWSETSIGYSTLPVYLAFEDTYEKEGLFTFYSHVVKASENTEDLSDFIRYVEAKRVWIASAGEAADWWILRSNLRLTVDGNRIAVKNIGDRPVEGVTVKISPGRQIKGALYTWGNEEITYAVLPRIEPGEEIMIL